MDKKGKIKMGLSLLVILALAFLALGAGKGGLTDDVPVVTGTGPEGSDTPIQTWDGSFAFNATANIPSGESDSALQNITLWMNHTDKINDSLYGGEIWGILMEANETFSMNSTIDNVSSSIFGNQGTAGTKSWPNGTMFTWGWVACNEQNNCTWSDNYSAIIDLHFDTTLPNIPAIHIPLNGTVTNNNRTAINFTVVDNVRVSNVTLYANLSATYQYPNETLGVLVENLSLLNTGAIAPFDTNIDNQTLTGNFSEFWFSNGLADGFWTIMMNVTDTNNNVMNSSQVQFEVDTVVPIVNQVRLAATPNTCDKYNLFVNSTEEVNITELTYWTEDGGVHTFENTVRDARFLERTVENFNGTINLTGLKYIGETYYYNLTVCDRHGNCNSSATGTATGTGDSFTKEWAACTGWNAYGIQTATILDDVKFNISGASTISWFNNTDNTFMNYIVNLTTNMNITAALGDAILVHTINDSIVNAESFTVDGKGTSVIGDFPVLFNGTFAPYGDNNWTTFGLLRPWKMGNFSESGFQNNMTFISWWNNSAQRYEDHINTGTVGRLWNNETWVRTGETIWAWTNKMPGEWHRNDTWDMDKP